MITQKIKVMYAEGVDLHVLAMLAEMPVTALKAALNSSAQAAEESAEDARMRFILRNYRNMTCSEMATELGTTFHVVMGICRRARVSAKRPIYKRKKTLSDRVRSLEAEMRRQAWVSGFKID